MGSRGPLLVLALVAIAGCNSIVLDDGPARESTDTLTPAPVTGTGPTGPETRTRTPVSPGSTAASELPPGVRSSGRVGSETLLSAHREALGGVSFQGTYRRVVRDPDSSRVLERFERQVTVDPPRIQVTDTGLQSARNRSIYVDGDTVFTRVATDGGTRVSRANGTGIEGPFLPAETMIRTMLVGLEFERSAVERGGQAYVRLYAPPGPAPPQLTDEPWDPPIRGFTATAYVSRSGLVKTMYVGYEIGKPEDAREVSIRFGYERLGSATVSPPAWVNRSTPTTSP